MSTPPLPPLTYSFVLSETKRIIFTSNSLHFNYLSLLFILPISFSLTIFPAVHTFLLHRGDSPPSSDQPQFHDLSPGLLFAIIPSVFTILAVGSITYSVIQIHYNRTPVTLIAAVKSAFTSFFPIAITQFVANFLYSMIAIVLLFAITASGINPESPWFLVAAVTYTVLVVSVLIYLGVNWSLAAVIAAAESQVGFSALKQSNYLVAGERLAVLCIFFPYSLAVWMSVSISSTVAAQLDDGGWSNNKCLFCAATIVFIWFLMTRLLLSLFVAKTVVYLYCKAARGGGGAVFKISDDDQKVPLLVSIAPSG